MSKSLDDIAEDAVKQVIGEEWAQSELTDYLRRMVFYALQKCGETGAATKVDPSEMDEHGWIEESWAAWRLVLRDGGNPSVVFFSREPTYAERKAFAAAAKVPVASAVAEARPK